MSFSRLGTQALLQYYMFPSLGFGGYRRVQQSSRGVATYVPAEIGKLDDFTLRNDGGRISSSSHSR